MTRSWSELVQGAREAFAAMEEAEAFVGGEPAWISRVRKYGGMALLCLALAGGGFVIGGVAAAELGAPACREAAP